MSTGLVICSVCGREVHQHLDRGWAHCEDGSRRCFGASSVYPKTKAEIKGPYCGADGPPPEN